MKNRVLVLGAGNRRSQDIHSATTEEELKAQGPLFDDNFKEVVTIDMDPAAKPQILWNLNNHPWPVASDSCDEVHAYEVLEHLTRQGEYVDFFLLWKEIWRVTKPGGFVCATTPWWQSLWVWQDPGHKMCYSRGLLMYLDQEQYERQIGQTAMTDYRAFWPKPYSFRWVWDAMVGEDPLSAGYRFILWKPHD